MAQDVSSGLTREERAYVIGEATHSSIYFISPTPPRVGEYVVVRHPEGDVLALVERSVMGNPLLPPDTRSMDIVTTAVRMGIGNRHYMLGQAKLLTFIHPIIEDGRPMRPKTPPPPGSEVLPADESVLAMIFGRQRRDCVREIAGRSYNVCVRLGTLLGYGERVEYYVNVERLVSRHLAILAVTGAGKSNTVAILARRIVEALNGTVLIIDPHSEYRSLAQVDELRDRVHVIQPRIHPAALTIDDYYQLINIGPSASKQRLYFKFAYDAARHDAAQARTDEFFDLLYHYVERMAIDGKYRTLEGNWENVKSSDKNSVIDVFLKLDTFRSRYYGSGARDFTLLDTSAPHDLEAMVVPGKINVLPIGELTEETQDVVASFFIKRLLYERKNYVNSGGVRGYPVPVLLIIEEAHTLIPANRSTMTKQYVAKVAREGRKFGVGMVLVSQRPRGLDEEALSQTNNKIILRIVSPDDLRQVRAASENLSEELSELLPSLNNGEAIVLGMMTPLPALVKIDLAEFKTGGTDRPIVHEWMSYLFDQVSADPLWGGEDDTLM